MRERVLRSAAELFYQKGIQAVGVDAIVSHAGVAKMSLYNHFKSKDELVAALLEQKGKEWLGWLKERVEARAEDPVDRLMAVFTVLGEWFVEPDFRGCLSMNAAAEIADAGHPVRGICAWNKAALREYLLGCCEAAGLRDAEMVAAQLAILVDGAIQWATLTRSGHPAECASAAAARLIEAAI